MFYLVEILLFGFNQVHVTFGASSSAAVTLSLDQVLPLSADSSDQEEDEEFDIDDDTEFAPVELALTREAGTSALGDWESGTRGIGSKLMSKMGYIHGTGMTLFSRECLSYV